MRVTGYGGMLINYLNSGRSLSALSSVLGTKQNNSYHTSGAVGNFSSILAQKQNAVQNSTRNAAQSMRDRAQVLSETGEDSLFARAERSGNKRALVQEVDGFVTDFNAMCKGMEQTGGSVNKIYLRQLSDYAKQHQTELENIGIQVSDSGQLTVDENALHRADLTALKKVFTGTNSFAGKAAVKSIYVESNAMSTAGYNSTRNALLSGYQTLGSSDFSGRSNDYSNYNNYNHYGNYNNYNNFSNYLMNSYLNTLI